MRKRSGHMTRVLFCLIFLAAVGFLAFGNTKEVQAATKTEYFKHVGNKTYYVDKNGSYHKGWLTLKKGNTSYKYYFNKTTGVMYTGWISDGTNLRYFSKNTTSDYTYGVLATGWRANAKGDKRYFATEWGELARGWATIDGAKHYFNKSTGWMYTKWVKDAAGNYRYFDPETGAMYTGWRYWGTQKRYFNKTSGVMYTGWISDGTNLRYFRKPGDSLNSLNYGIMATGLAKPTVNYYYFDTGSGVLFTGGRKVINGNNYYFDPKNNGRMLHGWLEEDGKKYYFGSNGVMYVNKTATISGQSWTFDSNGVATLNKYTTDGNGNVRVYENGRYYTLEPEFLSHPKIADGSMSDTDLLAAITDAEANDQGLVGMTAVALTILNRVNSSDTYYPDTLRYVIYQKSQYSPVTDGALLRRLNGQWEEKSTALKAAQNAISIMNAYKTQGTPRKISGFNMGNKKDFDFLFFMTPGAFASCNLDWDACETYQYVPSGVNPAYSHVFFVKWVTN